MLRNSLKVSDNIIVGGSSRSRKSVMNFSTSIMNLAARQTLTKEQQKELARKQAAKQLAKLRLKAKQSPLKSRLYSTIPNALRYLRAAEVGRSVDESTITLTSVIFNDKGAPPIKGNLVLPKNSSKQMKAMVITSIPEQADLATKNGIDTVGGEELIKKISDGEINLKEYNKLFATSELQSKLSSVAKILGPKGLMPNNKRGTMSADLTKILENNVDSIPFKQKNSYLTFNVGKTDFDDEEIIKNVLAVKDAVNIAIQNVQSKRPPIVGQTTLSSTHGPGFVINFN